MSGLMIDRTHGRLHVGGTGQRVGAVYVDGSLVHQPLEVLAPDLLAWHESPGDYPVARPVGPYEDRSLYVVYDTVNTSSAFNQRATLGTSASGTGRITLQTGPAGSSNMSTRFDCVGGSQNTARTLSARVPGQRDVVFLGTGSEMSLGKSGRFGGGVGMVTIGDRGDGMTPNPMLRIETPHSSTRTVAAVAYAGEHDSETVDAVMSWLALRYDVPVPAGGV